MFLTILRYYHKFQELLQVISQIETTEEDNYSSKTFNETNNGCKARIKRVYKAFKFIYKLGKEKYYHYHYGPINISKNLNVAHFYKGGEWYMFPIIVIKGPKPNIISAHNEHKDMTKFITALAGPNLDFYGCKITPCDIGVGKITINTDIKTLVFLENDHIVIDDLFE